MEACREIYEEVHKRKSKRQLNHGNGVVDNSVYINISNLFKFIWSICCILNSETIIRNYRGAVLVKRDTTSSVILLIICTGLLLHSIYFKKIYNIKIK